MPAEFYKLNQTRAFFVVVMLSEGPLLVEMNRSSALQYTLIDLMDVFLSFCIASVLTSDPLTLSYHKNYTLPPILEGI